MKNYRDAILFFFMSLFWAINYVLIKIAVKYENEFYLLFFRVLFALLLSLIIFRGSLYLKKSRNQLILFAVSMLNIVGFMELWFMGEMTESASISSIIVYSYPVMNVILSIFFLNERLGPVNYAGVVMGLSGIVVIFFDQIEINTITGLIFLVLSAFSWSVGTIIYKKYLNSIEPVKVNTMQYLYALPVTLIIAILSGSIKISGLSFNFIAIAIYMGTFGTSIAYFINLTLYRKYSISRISPYLFIVPAMSVIVSLIILNEKPTIFTLGGLGLVMVGIYLSQTGIKE